MKSRQTIAYLALKFIQEALPGFYFIGLNIESKRLNRFPREVDLQDVGAGVLNNFRKGLYVVREGDNDALDLHIRGTTLRNKVLQSDLRSQLGSFADGHGVICDLFDKGQRMNWVRNL